MVWVNALGATGLGFASPVRWTSNSPEHWARKAEPSGTQIPTPNRRPILPSIRVDLSIVNRKRGAPVLIELISRPNGPSVGGSPAAAYPSPAESGTRGGHPVSNPENWGAASSRSGGGAGRKDLRLPALLIGAGIVVVVVAAIIGYQLGQKKEKQDWAQNNSGTGGGGGGGGPQPGGTGGTPNLNGSGVVDPLNGGGGVGKPDPNAAAGGGVIKPAPVPALNPYELRDGWNYLVVATLRRSEAEEAATYLKDNRIPIQLVAAEKAGGGGGVDRGAAAANNGLWQLWVLEGVPSGEYSQRRTEREALETKVKMLGRTWKAQNRKAPTDFGSTYWVRYKA